MMLENHQEKRYVFIACEEMTLEFQMKTNFLKHNGYHVALIVGPLLQAGHVALPGFVWFVCCFYPQIGP